MPNKDRQPPDSGVAELERLAERGKNIVSFAESSPLPRLAVRGLGEDFDINRSASSRRRLVDSRSDFLNVARLRRGIAWADLAVETPEIHPLWQWLFPLAF